MKKQYFSDFWTRFFIFLPILIITVILLYIDSYRFCVKIYKQEYKGIVVCSFFEKGSRGQMSYKIYTDIGDTVIFLCPNNSNVIPRINDTIIKENKNYSYYLKRSGEDDTLVYLLEEYKSILIDCSICPPQSLQVQP